jgi:hypothetical protein
LTLAQASSHTVNYSISGLPSRLNVDIPSGTATTTPTIVTFSLVNAGSVAPGSYGATLAFTNATSGVRQHDAAGFADGEPRICRNADVGHRAARRHVPDENLAA